MYSTSAKGIHLLCPILPVNVHIVANIYYKISREAERVLCTQTAAILSSFCKHKLKYVLVLHGTTGYCY